MFSGISEICNRKVHCILKNDKKASRSESGPLFQPLPEASDDEEKVEDVDLEELWKHIFELRKLIDEGNDQKRLLDDFHWPNVRGLQHLKRIVVLRSDLTITDIHGDIKETLGRVNVATVAPLVVAQTLERFDATITNTALWRLTALMYDLAIALKKLSESPGGTQDVMQEATALIVEGARVFSRQRGPLKGGPPRSTSEVSAIIHKLETMYKNIKKELAVGAFTPMPQRRRSHLSKKYPHLLEKYSTHAESGPFSQPLPGACHDEAPFSGSFNVSMKSKGKNVDVSFNVSGTTRCDEASSSGYSDLPKRSGGQDFNVNLNISGAPRCDEAPSSSSSSGPTKSRSDLISSKRKDRVEDVNLKTLSESPEETQVVMEDATALIVEGAHVFSLQGGHRRSASEVRATIQKLDSMHKHITTKRTVFTPIQHQRRSHLWKEYPTHSDNGQVEEDLLFTRRQEVFKMEALVAATKNFHKDNKVGEGGAGAVYKGTTHDGKQIAVKKMLLTSDEGRKAFMNEKLLAEVQHRNVVNLLGSCEQESQGFLVYEYFPNKSLDKFLFDPEKRKRLDWHKRSNIILGIARGLLYLHQDSRVRIVHRDIKATNILLDDELNPQIADFGTANILPENKTHVTATNTVGTHGYMAPDILMSMRFSPRTEVYSFGILLLEILTGEKISSDAVNRLGWVWRLYNRKEALQTIDPTIIETWDKEAMKALRCIQVGLLCIQGDSCLRPTMAEVIAMLSTDMSLRDPEKPPCVPSYCATQENGNSAMEQRVNAFMRAVFEIQEQRVE